MKFSLKYNYLFIIIAFWMLTSGVSYGQDKELSKDSVVAAAREIIGAQKYCALVTIDSLGTPNIRTMNPFPPEADMTVWMATNSGSQKVKDIKRNPNVSLYYSDHSRATGYVSITGKAYLFDDMSEKEKRKRDYWTQAFPDWKYLLLIKVVPDKIEVVNYSKKMYNNSKTFKAPEIEMN